MRRCGDNAGLTVADRGWLLSVQSPSAMGTAAGVHMVAVSLLPALYRIVRLSPSTIRSAVASANSICSFAGQGANVGAAMSRSLVTVVKPVRAEDQGLVNAILVPVFLLLGGPHLDNLEFLPEQMPMKEYCASAPPSDVALLPVL